MSAAQMAALARQTAKIPDDAVAELVRWFVPRSQQIGGRMRWFGKTVKLSSRIKKRSRRQSSNTVILQGTPAAAWSIKSYGRRGGYPVRQSRAAPIPASSGLRLATVAPGVWFVVTRPTTGDRRWDRLAAEADRRFPDVVADLVAKRLG